MSKRKIVINEIPGNTSEISQNGTEEKIDKDLDYFRALYPESDEKLVCRLYILIKNDYGNEKRAFLEEFNSVPTEKDIAARFGGGDYELYLMRREGVKGGLQLQAKAKFTVAKVWTKTDTEIKQGLNNVKQGENTSIKDKLEELKMMKEVMFNDKNNSDSVMQMMLNMQTTLMTVFVELIKNSGKSDNKLIESILPTLLSKSLEKQNVLSDIETLAKLKEVFPSGDNGTDWGSIISSTLPLLLPMLQQSKNSNIQIPQRTQNKPLLIDKKLLKESVKEAITEINKDWEETEEGNITIDNSNSDPEETKEKNIHELNIKSEENIENDMNIKSQIKLIKNSPQAAQDQVLLMWCNIKPVNEVMQFCIDTELVQDKKEFIQRAKGVGIDTSDIEIE